MPNLFDVCRVISTAALKSKMLFFLKTRSIPSASGFLNLNPRPSYFKTRQVGQKAAPVFTA